MNEQLQNYLDHLSEEGIPDDLRTAELPAYMQDAYPAFSGFARHVIAERANGVSELGGFSEWPHMPLERAHINHDYDSPRYNDPGNGLMVTIIEHYAQHEMYSAEPVRIGITKEANDWATAQLLERCVEWCTLNKVSPGAFHAMVKGCRPRWKRVYATEIMKAGMES